MAIQLERRVCVQMGFVGPSDMPAALCWLLVTLPACTNVFWAGAPLAPGEIRTSIGLRTRAQLAEEERNETVRAARAM